MSMKKVILSICLISISIVSVYALSTKFTIDSTKLSFSTNGKKGTIVENFNQNYSLSHSISSDNGELEKEIEELTKKTTYLLLGNFNNTNESSEDYYKRHQEYLGLRYNPKVPEDESTFTGLDENSQEYKDDLVSGITVPSMFLIFDELNVIYSSFGNIRVSESGNSIMSAISLPNVTMREQSSENPMEYVNIQTNLIIYYYFKELDGQYKLYYLMGETTDELSDYFTEVESTENKSTMQVAPSYDSQLKDIYSYSKLEAITDEQINNIYNSNSKNILVFNSYYNNYLVTSSNGFFINDGLVVTTWNFLEKSLAEAQFIAIKDNNGNSYEIDGIVTANPETDVVVIKLKDKVSNKVVLGNSKELKTEDPVISISSKTGIGLTVQSGIVISNDGYIGSAIPLTNTDEGSPLLNSSGQVVGMNTAKQVNTSISLAINSDVLKEIQDKFNNTKFEDIEVISFNKLKEEYYYIKYNEEIVKNDIPSGKWKTYSKIGNIEENISLELVKANYKDGIVSLRYHNGISEYIDNMQLATGFKEQLIKDGYKEKLSSSKKCIYENKKYQVIIMSEFDYLIVVMVKL